MSQGVVVNRYEKILLPLARKKKRGKSNFRIVPFTDEVRRQLKTAKNIVYQEDEIELHPVQVTREPRVPKAASSVSLQSLVLK